MSDFYRSLYLHNFKMWMFAWNLERTFSAIKGGLYNFWWGWVIWYWHECFNLIIYTRTCCFLETCMHECTINFYLCNTLSMNVPKLFFRHQSFVSLSFVQVRQLPKTEIVPALCELKFTKQYLVLLFVPSTVRWACSGQDPLWKSITTPYEARVVMRLPYWGHLLC